MISWNRPGIISRQNPAHSICVIINVLITTFLAVLSASATIIADTAIQGELALSDSLTIWLTTLYLLGINTIVPTASWFADRFGYKTMYMVGLVTFALSSALAGLSTDFLLLGAARLLEGIGAGFIFPIGLALIAQHVSPQRLPLAMLLYIGAAFGAGFALGFPLSGYCTQFLSWRLIFFIIAPLGILGAISCWLIHEETERKKTSNFDIFGFLSFASFIAFFLIALTCGPLRSTDDGWRSPYIIACFVLAALSALAMIAIESKRKDPMIPITLFKDPIFTIACITLFLLGMSTFASASVMMQYMINALSYEKYVSGKMGIIYGIALASCSVLANVLTKKIPVAVMTFAGLAILVYSYFLGNELDWQTGPKQILTILFLRGVGIGLSLGPTTLQAMRHVPQELSNQGATLLTFFRQVGGTYGGTLIGILIIKRKIFHADRFGAQANDQLPAYKITFQKLYDQFAAAHYSPYESTLQAKMAIVHNIENQAYIQAINDAMIVVGYVISAVALILATLSLWRWRQHRKSSLPLSQE